MVKAQSAKLHEANHKTQNLSELQTQFRKIILKVPRKARLELSAEIKAFQNLFEDAEDLVNLDARSLTWAPGSKTREQVNSRKDYELVWRGSDPIRCNLEEAAVAVARKTSSLRSLISTNKGVWSGSVFDGHEHHFVQIYKLDADGNRPVKAQSAKLPGHLDYDPTEGGRKY